MLDGDLAAWKVDRHCSHVSLRLLGEAERLSTISLPRNGDCLPSSSARLAEVFVAPFGGTIANN
jgi:hypothetical protein